jgi:hypothetical protein
MFERLFKREPPSDQFWKWFRSREARLFDFELDQERIFDDLTKQLGKVDSDLTFEFGPKQAGKREFVVSAGGIKRAFPAVSALVAAAPPLDRWQVTAFRPRRSPINIIKLAGSSVDPRHVEFSLSYDGSVAAIQLFIPGYNDLDMNLQQIAYLLLDESLGEFDVEMKIGPIEVFSLEATRTEERFPLNELPARFDQLIAQHWPVRPI